MNWFVYHVASGTAFFSGAACILAAAALGTRDLRWLRRVAVLLALVGVVLITISSTPLPLGYYLPASAALLVWLLACDIRGACPRHRHVAAGALSLLVLFGVALEIPYHFAPSLVLQQRRALVILGDSVTAGMGEGEAETWPAILERTRSLVVHDYSHMGATAASALKKARKAAIPDGLVLLEIGGNDLLGSATPQGFCRDLNALLECVCADGRQVVMLELPLPPLRNEFGRIQRDLAHKHKVALIPKRVFLGVLSGNSATLDSIHLSQSGHHLMAEAMWKVLRTAFEPGTSR